MANVRKKEVAIEPTVQYLSIRFDGRLFGLQVLQIRDVIRDFRITHIPLAPASVLGAINLRGRIVTMINLKQILGFPDDEKESLLATVIEHEGELYAFAIDGVEEVLDVQPSKIERNPANLDSSWREFCLGVLQLEKDLMVFLDIEKVFSY